MEVIPILDQYMYLDNCHDNVSKYVGIPNSFTIASTSYKNCFQYDVSDILLTELTNENLHLQQTFQLFF